MEDDKPDTIFPLPFWIVLLIVAFTWPSIVWADTLSATTDNTGSKLTLQDKPCPLGPWFEKWRTATWFYRGQNYDACWRVQRTPEGMPIVVVIDSTGITSDIPAAAFRKDEGV